MAIKTCFASIALLGQLSAAFPQGNSEALYNQSISDIITRTSQTPAAGTCTFANPSTDEPYRVIHYMHQATDNPFVAKDEVNVECGYTLNSTKSTSFALFTDMIETDWVHTTKVEDSDWKPVVWNLSCHQHSKVENVRENPLHGNDWAGHGQHWGQAGLQLIAPKPSNKSIGVTPQAFVRTKRSDILHGSFRVAAKIADEPGTFAAFTWRAADNNDSPKHVLIGYQFPSTNMSKAAKIWSGKIENFDICSKQQTLFSDADVNLATANGNDLHEFRFDWMPNHVDFWVDGQWMWQSTEDVPETPGSLELSIWSNNDIRLGAVQQEQTVFTVVFTKAYFNTTGADSPTAKAWQDGDCEAWDLGKRTHMIEEQLNRHDFENGKSFFFSNEDTWQDNMVEHLMGNGTGEVKRLTMITTAVVAMTVVFAALLL